MGTKLLMKGNEALAEAAIRAGLKGYFGYPITPQSELLEYLSKELPKRGGAFVQDDSGDQNPRVSDQQTAWLSRKIDI